MSTAQQETLSIDGMGCDHCVRAVRDALTEIDGLTVEDVEIGSARVAYDPNAVSRETIAEAVEDAGFSLAA